MYLAAASTSEQGGCSRSSRCGSDTSENAQVFKFARGQHNVIRVAKPDCSFSNATQVAGLTDTPFNLTFREPGTFYYACSVSGHCDEGMLLTVRVSGEPSPLILSLALFSGPKGMPWLPLGRLVTEHRARKDWSCSDVEGTTRGRILPPLCPWANSGIHDLPRNFPVNVAKKNWAVPEPRSILPVPEVLPLRCQILACWDSGDQDDGIADSVAAKAAPAESGVQRKQPATAGDSHCEPPVLVAGTNDTFHVTCLSPGVPLKPGQACFKYL